MTLDDRVRRDGTAAVRALTAAQGILHERGGSTELIDLRTGPTDAQLDRQAWRDDRGRTLAGIADRPFHAMMEVITELRGPHGALDEKSQLWYASETSTTNEVLGTGSDRINVLAWSHPGVQLALSGKLHEFHDISASGYRLAGVEPIAHARFVAVMPEISGLYEPGGPVRPAAKAAPSVGLKAVKLSMTSDQVNAFISRMTGLMLVTGAPGSGKTTVAFQRIRFLCDQQALRNDGPRMAPFIVTRTRVFLANANLVAYSRKMLVEQLDIPDRVVELIDPFIDDLLSRFWAYTHGARPRQRRLTVIEEQARRAYFGLCRADMLATLWLAYERQISERLAGVSESMWVKRSLDSTAGPLSAALAHALAACGGRKAENGDPLASRLRLDSIYQEVQRPYEAFRQALGSNAREAFDESFQQVLFAIYDPLSALAAAFGPLRMDGGGRIARGTGHQARETEVLDALEADWAERRYGPEEQPWFAWLLRFALSEVDDPSGTGPLSHDARCPGCRRRSRLLFGVED